MKVIAEMASANAPWARPGVSATMSPTAKMPGSDGLHGLWIYPDEALGPCRMPNCVEAQFVGQRTSAHRDQHDIDFEPVGLWPRAD